MNALGITPRQKILLDFIRAYIATHGYSPSFDEMQKGIGLQSKSPVHALVHGLHERGRIKLAAGRHRSIVVKETR